MMARFILTDLLDADSPMTANRFSDSLCSGSDVTNPTLRFIGEAENRRKSQKLLGLPAISKNVVLGVRTYCYSNL